MASYTAEIDLSEYQYGFHDEEAPVIKIDREERRLGLSIKAANYSADQLEAEAATYDSMKSGNDLMNLGDILDEATGKE